AIVVSRNPSTSTRSCAGRASHMRCLLRSDTSRPPATSAGASTANRATAWSAVRFSAIACQAASSAAGRGSPSGSGLAGIVVTHPVARAASASQGGRRSTLLELAPQRFQLLAQLGLLVGPRTAPVGIFELGQRAAAIVEQQVGVADVLGDHR